ncbi:hypothetical protein FDA09_08615 [Clostridium botulinum]|uniref:hypothetical protein n=1 Tax=Clostridium botulinum TaxID=1491 RepID=UPI000774CA40|nr:hypothetical protein [Clostridium botulinum]NFH79863.1 hypothetical protein [Clostridium botulinum]NFH82292.1 hypothetical protein [Clostridium botulinum]NFI11447.1 hypothetical protein [Clostridium botulinum]NFI14502.1 hypothetical protein [Clostridium botulinum]NFO84555.1 hypothetical protein [Clostridium botulinum]
MEKKIEFLKVTSEYIIQLEKNIEEIVKILQGTEYKEGIKALNSIIEGINLVAIAVENTKELHKKEISLNKLNEKLNEIVQALENEDNILMADLFQYELLPIIENIKTIIDVSILNKYERTVEI